MRRNRRRILAGLLSLTLFLTCFEQMTVQVLANELEQQELEDNDDEKNIDEEEIELSEGEDDEALSEESETDGETNETTNGQVEEETPKEDTETDESEGDLQKDEIGCDEESEGSCGDNANKNESNEDKEEEITEEIQNIKNNSIGDEISKEQKAVEFKLNHTELTMPVCSTNYLTIDSEIACIDEKDFFWESSNEEIVYVEDGEIAALSIGTAVITVRDMKNEMEASCKINVISQHTNARILSTYSTSYNASSALTYAEKNWNVNAYSVLCSEFVSNCIKAGGVPSNIWSKRATVLRNLLKSSGLGTEYSCQFSSDGYFYKSNAPSVIAPGDVVFYHCASCDDGKPYSIHVVLFNGFDGSGRMKAYSHNGPSNGASAYKYSTKNGAAKCYDCGRQISTLHVYHFNGNNGPSQGVTNTLPQGMFDSAGGGEGTIEVNGWAFDRDDYSKQLMIHLYVGGPAGSGAFYQMLANQSRPDVANAYPSAQVNCGFNGSIKVNERGSQQVYAYAIDAQEPWKNTLLGVKTVTIKNVPFSMQFGQNPINIKLNESKDFSCKFTGDGIYTLGYTLSDLSVANMVGMLNLNWTNGTCDIRVKGLKVGSTTLTIFLMDSNNKELYSKSLSVTVKQPVTSVSLNKSSTSLEVGKTERLTASVAPSNASNKNITWSSSNTNIATVSNGVITARSAGTATITATAADGSGKKATCSVTVKKASTPFSITFDQTGVNLNKGNTNTLNITFKGDGIYTLGYAFDDSTVASATWGTVDYTKGTTSIVLKGLKAGRALLTIHLKDSAGKSLYSKNINISINVPLQNITLNKTSGRLKVGETDSLTVSYYPSDTTVSKTVTWTSSNTNVATVSGGKITAKNEGTATITATVQNKKVTYSLTVVPAVIKVSNISLNNTNIQLYLDSSIDKSRELSAYITPSNATNKEIVWSSSNTKVASVSNKGMVTAVSSGTATITATAVDGSGKKASCLVTACFSATVTGSYTA
ncbi:Ig-like domain-containing protein, partial [Bacteroides congonensis]|uniref:Ig-like domain-containing protein n=1 Tax=Bacteroides congonensis TaxID=1871006 RepID=UPI0032197619